MANKSSKSKAKKSSKPKTKRSGKLKAKKSYKSKRGVMAKKSKKSKRNIAAIDSKFYGTYTSTVQGVSAMNGTLVVPDPSNSNNVLYTLSADGTSYSVQPAFNGNLISFSFSHSGDPYSFIATSWTPAGPSSPAEWIGTGSCPTPIEEQGVWKAKG